jgi:hypothetical protein
VWACFRKKGTWGAWHEISPLDLVYNVGVMSEMEYLRSFPDVPPLPDTAFRGDPWARATDRRDWSSPLV